MCVHCTLQCMRVAQSSPGGAGSLVVASTCCLCLDRSLCGAVLRWLLCAVSALGGLGCEGEGNDTVGVSGEEG